MHDVEILAYCLMTNHIHLVAVPMAEDRLQRVLKPLHMRYAQRFNRAHGWQGHVWQGRYFSSPLDEAYRWSSAAAHCSQVQDDLLKLASDWNKQFSAVEDWSAWLAE